MTLTMESTSAERIVEIREKQRKYFHSGATLDVKARKAALKKFEQAVLKWEKPLCDALWADLHKSYEEAYLTEISILLGEIRTQFNATLDNVSVEEKDGTVKPFKEAYKKPYDKN